MSPAAMSRLVRPTNLSARPLTGSVIAAESIHLMRRPDWPRTGIPAASELAWPRAGIPDDKTENWPPAGQAPAPSRLICMRVAPAPAASERAPLLVAHDSWPVASCAQGIVGGRAAPPRRRRRRGSPVLGSRLSAARSWAVINQPFGAAVGTTVSCTLMLCSVLPVFCSPLAHLANRAERNRVSKSLSERLNVVATD